MSKINGFNITKKPAIKTSNSFSNELVNKISISSLINDQCCLFPIKNLHHSTFDYSSNLDRKYLTTTSLQNRSSIYFLTCKGSFVF